MTKLDADIFPEEDAREITQRLNVRMSELGIPFYSLVSDLEGLVISKSTIETTKAIYQKYYEQSFIDFEKTNKNASEQEYLKALRKAFGSKTHLLERSPRDRKKPHIPIEIITNFILENEINNNPDLIQTILDSFPELNFMKQTIEKRIKIE